MRQVEPILPLSYRRGEHMSARERLTTVVSTKGQVILPKAVRQRLDWATGAETGGRRSHGRCFASSRAAVRNHASV